MAEITWFSRSVASQVDFESWLDQPLYDEEIRYELMSKIDPHDEIPPTITKEIDYGGETYQTEIRPVHEHWALYFMDGLKVRGGPGGQEAYNRFLEKHVPVCRGGRGVEEMGINLVQTLALAVKEATLEHYAYSEAATPHYIH